MSNLSTCSVVVNDETGLDLIARSELGSGILFADLDLDHWPDLFVANGHIWDKTTLGPQYEYQMRPRIVRNLAGRRFKDASLAAGGYFSEQWLARAAAVGDRDNDGDPDLVVQHLAAQPAILRNDQSQVGGVLIELIGITSARRPLGTSIFVVRDGEQMTLRIPSGDSFQESHDHRVLVPAGSEPTIDEVHVTWSNGDREIWGNVSPDGQSIRLRQGLGDVPLRIRPVRNSDSAKFRQCEIQNAGQPTGILRFCIVNYGVGMSSPSPSVSIIVESVSGSRVTSSSGGKSTLSLVSPSPPHPMNSGSAANKNNPKVRNRTARIIFSI